MKKNKLLTGAIYCLYIFFLTIALFSTGYSATKKAAVKTDEPVIIPMNYEKFESKKYDTGFSAGFWMPGTITVENIDLDKSIGPLIRIFGDLYINPKFAIGGYFNYSTATLSYESYEADADFLEFGVSFKPRFFIRSDMALKPGLNIGYRIANRELLYGLESPDTDTTSRGLGLDLSVELQFMQPQDYIFFIETGFLTQPTGGNSDADVTWGPILYFTCGITF